MENQRFSVDELREQLRRATTLPAASCERVKATKAGMQASICAAPQACEIAVMRESHGRRREVFGHPPA